MLGNVMFLVSLHLSHSLVHEWWVWVNSTTCNFCRGCCIRKIIDFNTASQIFAIGRSRHKGVIDKEHNFVCTLNPLRPELLKCHISLKYAYLFKTSDNPLFKFRSPPGRYLRRHNISPDDHSMLILLNA